MGAILHLSLGVGVGGTGQVYIPNRLTQKPFQKWCLNPFCISCGCNLNVMSLLVGLCSLKLLSFCLSHTNISFHKYPRLKGILSTPCDTISVTANKHSCCLSSTGCQMAYAPTASTSVPLACSRGSSQEQLSIDQAYCCHGNIKMNCQ